MAKKHTFLNCLIMAPLGGAIVGLAGCAPHVDASCGYGPCARTAHQPIISAPVVSTQINQSTALCSNPYDYGCGAPTGDVYISEAPPAPAYVNRGPLHTSSALPNPPAQSYAAAPLYASAPIASPVNQPNVQAIPPLYGASPDALRARIDSLEADVASATQDAAARDELNRHQRALRTVLSHVLSDTVLSDREAGFIDGKITAQQARLEQARRSSAACANPAARGCGY